MPKDIEKLLKKLEVIKAPINLSELIINKICEENIIIAKRKFAFFGIATFLSGIATAITVIYSINAFSSTGFYQYLSLVFSEGTGLVSLWKEFAFTLVESIPYLGITLVLASLFVLLTTLRSTFKYIKMAFNN